MGTSKSFDCHECHSTGDLGDLGSPSPTNAGAKNHCPGLPTPEPARSTGFGFATQLFSIGEVELTEVSTFLEIWSSAKNSDAGCTFFQPVNLPANFHNLGYYAQTSNAPLQGRVLAVKGSLSGENPPLANPVTYNLIWKSDRWNESPAVIAYFWKPVASVGYTPLGYVVSISAETPSVEAVVCARSDLTEQCKTGDLVWSTSAYSNDLSFGAWNTQPLEIGTQAKGINVGTFYCNSSVTPEASLPISILKNVDFRLDLMPTLDQVYAILHTYGPTVYFHPNEEYLPCSPTWFFQNGALLYTEGSTDPPVRVAEDGSNLPVGGSSDHMYWIDLPNDATRDDVKRGNIESAVAFVHVKPMFGGTVTDVAFWFFYAFNGSSTLKVGIINSVSLGKIGQHVGDWEHFTLRINNFSGELQQVFLAEHSDGQWIKPNDLEFTSGNRPVVYSAKDSHATYPHEGVNLQGDQKRGIGIRNDTKRSTILVDASVKAELISVEYLSEMGETAYPAEPQWLQFMREWGPKIDYDSKTELDKVLRHLPAIVRNPVESVLNKLPKELGGEEGPTGPKEKLNWLGDE